MAVDPWSAGASVLGAGLGAIGSRQASIAQERAARNASSAARRNNLMQLAINEPLRNTGYQALADINSFFGYSTPQYSTANQLASSMNKLTYKDVKKMLGAGATFDQIAQMGTLGGGGKSIKRLLKAGLTMDQITQLRNGVAQSASQGGGTGAANGGGAPGQMNWDAITQAPDYQFQLQQGTKDLGNTFAARGGAASGNALRALSQFNQGLASQGLDKFIARRMGLVNGGQQAINNVGQAGNNYARAYGDSQQTQGDARASGIYNGLGAIMGGISGIAGAWGNRGGYTGYNYGGGYQGADYGLGTPAKGSWDQINYNNGWAG